MADHTVTITTIYPPSEAVKKIARKHRLIVAGDKKTPKDWEYENVRYISPEEQSHLPYKLIGGLPFNHYSRKMIAYLEAIKEGAEIIIDTDDDNIPKESLYFPELHGSYKTTPQDKGFVNVYKSFSDQHIWPRGLPLDRIDEYPPSEQNKNVDVGVWQALADGDPDVDAIYRLVNNTPCVFKDREPLVLGRGTLSPYNSQNTATRRELFPLLYLPAFVTFRFTDILRGWVAQPIMWAAGYHLGFSKATVIQERNPHDYMKDFESEVPCYLLGGKVIEATNSKVNSSSSVSDNLLRVYEELRRIKIVSQEEVELLNLWLKDLEEIL